jgi:hypothetical protein
MFKCMNTHSNSEDDTYADNNAYLAELLSVFP